MSCRIKAKIFGKNRKIRRTNNHPLIYVNNFYCYIEADLETWFKAENTLKQTLALTLLVATEMLCKYMRTDKAIDLEQIKLKQITKELKQTATHQHRFSSFSFLL